MVANSLVISNLELILEFQALKTLLVCVYVFNCVFICSQSVLICRVAA